MEFSFDAWEQRKLGEVAKRVQGNDGRMELPTLTISASSGWLDQRERFSSNIAGKEQQNYTLLSKGELSYNKGNSKLAKYGVVFELKSHEEALVPRVYHSFKTTNKSDSAFIEYLFSTKKPDSELGKLITSGARMDGLLNINYEDFMGIKINIPFIEEQVCISNFLRKLDTTIAFHQRKLEKMKELKKAYLQVMFPQDGESVPRLRFNGFSDKWKTYKLGEIAEFNPKTSLPDTFKYVDLESVVGIAMISHRIENKDSAPSRAQRVAKKGDVFYQTVRPYQKNNYLFDIDSSDYVFSTGYAQLRPAGDSYFLLSKLQEESFVANALDRSTGTSYPAINSKDLAEIEVSIPKFQEQFKIGNFFKSLDNVIVQQKQKVDSIQLLKQSYLQKMFT